jgi:predicted lactoylglutathione lyase
MGIVFLLFYVKEFIMVSDIFVNLPVKDLNSSKAFFEKLGFSFNKQFTDDTAAALVLGEHIYAMLLTHDKFKQFSQDKEIVDAHTSVEALLALGVSERDAVDYLADKAVELGGKAFRTPDDYGFMYARSIEDLDGHVWEIMWMDPAHVEQ